MLNFTFLFNKKHGLFDFKRHNSFQNKNNRKATQSFIPSDFLDLWFFLNLQQELENSMMSVWVGATQKLT